MINISDELAEVLARHIWEYPSLFQTGGDVIHSLFFGYQYVWQLGDLVSEFEDEYVDHYGSLEDYLAWSGDDNTWAKDHHTEQYWIHFEVRETALLRAKSHYLTHEAHRVVDHREYDINPPITCLPDDAAGIWVEAHKIALWIVDEYPDYHEYQMIERYKKLEETYFAFAEKIGKYYMPKVKEALEEGRISDVEKFLTRCPDVVTQAYIADAIRQSDTNWKGL